jgi:DNA repair exonuclease SbcCD nuclease subunit
MFRFIHSADWQLGARFVQFSHQAAALREFRLQTLRRALEAAREHSVDAFFVAGDLFEDNQVADSLVAAVVRLFAEYPDVPVYLLPGNHDPQSGLDSVWQRKALLNPPANVHVLREAGATALGENVYLLAAPLHQKLSTTDPSLRLVAMAAALPPGAIKIGLTHGALAIEGKHQPNDFPIALHAASRAGLDYLGLGHWHNWLNEFDGGRILMPGTPEPDQFANVAGGCVALVEIAGPGRPLLVRQLPVASLTWRSLPFDFLSADASRATLAAAIAELSPKADRTVLRVTLTGTASPAEAASVRGWLEPALAPFLVGQLVDDTRVALSPVELADLQARHPILAQVLADVDRLETLATGTVAGPPVLQPAGSTPLTLAEAEAMLDAAKIKLTALTPAHFAQLRQTLLQTLQEVTAR